MINQISFKNMKGQTDTQELSGLDLFIGPNGSGKTTRFQAIGLSMLGYVPGKGKTTAETFKLATGDEMASGCKLANGFEFTRTFSKKNSRERKTGKTNVKISETLTVSPGQGEKNPTQMKARVAAEMGEFAVALDFNEFLSLSDAKRRDFIYSLSPFDSAAWTKERVQRHLESELLIPELQENNPEQYDIYKELIQNVMAKFPENYDIHQGLQAMIDYTTTQKSYWGTKQKDSQGAVRSIAEAKNQLAETDRGIAEAKKELDALQDQLVKVEKQISKDTELRKINEDRSKRILELEQQIKDLGNVEVAKPFPIDNELAEINQNIDSLKAQEIKKVDVSIELLAVKENKVSLKSNSEKTTALIKDLTKQINDIESREQQMQHISKSLDEALSKASDVGGKCVIHSLISCPKDFTGFDGFVERKKAELDAEMAILANTKSKHKETFSEFKNKLNDINDQIDALDGQMEAIYKKSEEANKAISGRDDKIKKLEKEKDDLVKQHDKQLTDIKTAHERTQNRIQLLEQELDKLRNKAPEAIGDTSVMEKQIAGTREQIQKLKQSVDEKVKAKETILLLQKSMLENRVSEYKSYGFKAISKALGPAGVQGELVKETLEPLREDIRTNLKLMGFDNSPYFDMLSDTGQEIFQFGWVNQREHKVNFDALSAGEQTVFLAAIMATIIERANPKIKILAIDDINHLDRVNLQRALDGISKIGGKMDNIILGGAVECDFDAGEWKVWEMGAAGEVAKSA